MSYETIIYEVDTTDRVATITLNRPHVLNAFNRTMCHEVRDVWRQIKGDRTIIGFAHADRRDPQAEKAGVIAAKLRLQRRQRAKIRRR